MLTELFSYRPRIFKLARQLIRKQREMLLLPRLQGTDDDPNEGPIKSIGGWGIIVICEICFQNSEQRNRNSTLKKAIICDVGILHPFERPFFLKLRWYDSPVDRVTKFERKRGQGLEKIASEVAEVEVCMNRE